MLPNISECKGGSGLPNHLMLQVCTLMIISAQHAASGSDPAGTGESSFMLPPPWSQNIRKSIFEVHVLAALDLFLADHA